MRILTGYMTATSGQAEVAGYDVFWQPLEARRRIGYLPENCPLYTEMRVNEYLHFRAGLKGLAGNKRTSRCSHVMRKCWLKEVKRQLIGTLSKGFRQRVGLADALLADPPVLILDEPTAGLDPTQIRETRQLIRELGKEHTILLSTHILPEVEMTCDRVIIIHRGRVAAAATMAELSRGPDGARVIFADVEGVVDKELVQKLPGVGEVTTEPIEGGTRIRVTQAGSDDVTSRLCGLAVECGWKVREIRAHRQSLEERFVRIVEGEEN
jgi:ABC-2 type transport system ATP-binding protein